MRYGAITRSDDVEDTAATAAGHGGVLDVEGPLGIGKTELVAATVATARHRGLRMLRALGGELEGTSPPASSCSCSNGRCCTGCTG
ncbi:hypothetical protein PA7_30970 [Pseudonocardia asaccharolytica DSM 44247 = NBRC 16224]|uniref:Orc1-like AAA ATPase domain-containing protein n=1 Tax=Pseudonocardia asaccharolytica DSM 44247 = NBRC 16224 TaxID=1123024 RepID=A0A511D3A4_9PSEU|nr:hypothetical protein PA7_30970 [Pseudonocardia asaccharolytica DSM 44247 = NBRC 16224]